MVKVGQSNGSGIDTADGKIHGRIKSSIAIALKDTHHVRVEISHDQVVVSVPIHIPRAKAIRTKNISRDGHLAFCEAS